MRIDQVRAVAFGPLRGAVLDLAPGLTVVHGPNEAGKSTWFAATYSGLAGRRRARGRGTRAQAQFAHRHKPWSGSQWSAGVTISLDDGTAWALEHDLRSNGESRIVDVSSGSVVPLAVIEGRLGRELVTDGGVDGARILGLNRDSVRSTIFVAQADVLRVMEDASELQELLERVATTETADVTTEAALQWLVRLRTERVGVPHVGSRPLRATTLALEAARRAATTARDHWTALIEVLVERQEVEAALRSAGAVVQDLESAQRWLVIDQLERRVEQARRLAAVDQTATAMPADEAVVRRVTMLLGAFESRGDLPVLPEGPDAASLQADLGELPTTPVGDLEPRAEINEAYEELTRAASAVETHHRNGPESGAASTIPVGADELRDLAARLSEAEPRIEDAKLSQLEDAERTERGLEDAFAEAEVAYRAALERNSERQREYDEQLAEYRVQQEEYAAGLRVEEAALQSGRSGAHAAPAKRSSRITAVVALVAGLAGLALGGLLAAQQDVALGGALAVAGVVLLVVGAFQLRSSDAPEAAETGPTRPTPSAPTPPDAPVFERAEVPPRPQPSPELAQLRAEVAAGEMALKAHRETVDGARRDAAALDLPPDPDQLRALARAADDAAAAQERAQQHSVQAADLEERLAAAAGRLTQMLGADGEDSESEQTPDRARHTYESYVQDCRARALQARNAARRDDVARALEQRLELERRHETAVEEWHRAGIELARLASELELSGEDDPPALLRRWVEQQDGLRAAFADDQERQGRLRQVLDGRTVEELSAELEALRAGAGERPHDLPDQLEERLETARRREQALRTQAGALRGRQQQLAADLSPVARALEEEASAERAAAAVRELASGLELATVHLAAAKERSHATVAPALENVVRPRLPQLTGGRYLDVKINPADLTMKVTESNGAVRDAHLLSHGTTEQLYLLLRLALAQTLASVDETAPLVLDDVTVQSDRTRTFAVLDLLHEVSKERQVVLFSQEDEVLAWAEQHLSEPQDRTVFLQVD